MNRVGLRRYKLNGSRLRAFRLATAVTIGGVFALSAAPALADSGISYYNGSGSGTAVNLSVSPNAVLNANLSQVQSIINQLPLGAGKTVDNVAGSTLANPLSSINIQVDGASARGVAAGGTSLTDGAASSTALSVQADSLKSELDLLNAMLQNLPAGTAAALQNALAPIIANDPTGQVAPALAQLNAQLGGISDTLGSPSVNVLQTVTAKFGEDKKSDVVDLKQGGVLSQVDSYHLDPFYARALPTDASATNGLASLDIAPSVLGKLGATPLNVPSLSASLATLQAALQQAENKLTGQASQIPLVGNTAKDALGTLTGTVNSTTSQVVTIGGQTVDLTKINDLINQIAALRSSLSALDGLQMNDIVQSGAATAAGTLQRQGDKVQATGSSQAGRIDAVKMTNPVLANALKQVTGQDFTGMALVTVDGIAANASVVLDGHSPANVAADGHLVDVKVLGHVVSTDALLAPGTSCTISVPGKSTCGAIAGAPVSIPDTTNGLVSNLLTITLTRGAAQFASTNSITTGAAKIVTLEVKVDVNLDQVTAVAKQIPALPLSLPVSLSGKSGAQTLLDAQFGAAAAEASLNPAVACQLGCQTPVRPPSTGNEVLPLALLAVFLLAGAVGIFVQQRMRGVRG
jgi:hypothetical protein